MEFQGFTELVKKLSQSELDELLEVTAQEELRRNQQMREQRQGAMSASAPGR